MPKSQIATFVAVISAGLVSISLGSTVAYTDAGASAGTNTGNLNIGREFTVGTGGITVLELGAFDSGGDGLVNSHDVTLFSITGSGVTPAPENELSTVNVPSGTAATLNSGFRFEPITPIFLPAGNYAVVVYGFNVSGGDPFGNGGGTPSGPVVAGINFDPFEFTSNTNPAFPGNGDTNNHSSTSFIYNAGNTTPEPASLSLIGISGAALMVRRRRA